MNKKFSTLLAGVALFGATSAFAGNNVPSLIVGHSVTSIRPRLLTKLKKIVHS